MRRKEHGEEVLFIVEVYYSDHDSDVIGWTEMEAVYGEDIDELERVLTWMRTALDKPILDEAALLERAEQRREQARWDDNGGQ